MEITWNGKHEGGDIQICVPHMGDLKDALKVLRSNPEYGTSALIGDTALVELHNAALDTISSQQNRIAELDMRLDEEVDKNDKLLLDYGNASDAFSKCHSDLVKLTDEVQGFFIKHQDLELGDGFPLISEAITTPEPSEPCDPFNGE